MQTRAGDVPIRRTARGSSEKNVVSALEKKAEAAINPIKMATWIEMIMSAAAWSVRLALFPP